jgi:hypothetical protein
MPLLNSQHWLFLRINNERNSKIYLYQKEDNTIFIDPNITINFKIILNTCRFMYLWNLLLDLQTLLLSVITSFTADYKLQCNLACSVIYF